MSGGFVRPEVDETVPQRVAPVVPLAVADMEIAVGIVELRLDPRQVGLAHGEVRRDAVPLPQVALFADQAPRAGADDEALPLGGADHVHRHRAGRIAGFQRAVNVETDDDQHIDSGLLTVRLRWGHAGGVRSKSDQGGAAGEGGSEVRRGGGAGQYRASR